MRGPVDRLVHWATTKPDAPALLGTTVRVSYAQLLRDVQARAQWLHQAGVSAGDTVALGLAPAEGQYPIQVALFYAIAYVGAVVLPLYPEVGLDRRGALSDQLGAKWLISGALPDPCRAVVLDPARSESPTLAVDAIPPRGDQSSRPFFYEFTSGTTGTPKAMCFTGEECVARVVATAQQFGWRADDVMVPPLRWPTKVGIKGLVRALALGAAYADLPFPETRQALAMQVAQMGVTCMGSSPWQLRRLLASAALPDGGHVPLRVLGTAGAHIAPHEVQAVRETLVRNFHVGYGTTEIGLMGHQGPEESPDAPLRLVPGMACQALGADGQPLPAGQMGRLRFSAPWIPTRYATGNTDATEGFHNGWFVSSDFGSVDAQGRITLGGRTDDVINVGGAKIHPHDVEQALAAHPDVADAAVVGVADAMSGEIAVAFLVLHRPIALEAMLAFLAPRLERSHIPAAIAGVDVIPRNPEGKVLRQALRDIYAQRIAAQRLGAHIAQP